MAPRCDALAELHAGGRAGDRGARRHARARRRRADAHATSARSRPSARRSPARRVGARAHASTSRRARGAACRSARRTSPTTAAAARWRAARAPGDVVLVKASRGMRLERVLDGSDEAATQAEAQLMLFHLLYAAARPTPAAWLNVLRYTVDAHPRGGDHGAAASRSCSGRGSSSGCASQQIGEKIRDGRPADAQEEGRHADDGRLADPVLVVVATLLWCDLRNRFVWLTLLVTVGFGAIGFVDDYLKLSKRNKGGPRRRAASSSASSRSPAAPWLPASVGRVRRPARAPRCASRSSTSTSTRSARLTLASLGLYVALRRRSSSSAPRTR